jgi:hypothetical protein
MPFSFLCNSAARAIPRAREMSQAGARATAWKNYVATAAYSEQNGFGGALQNMSQNSQHRLGLREVVCSATSRGSSPLGDWAARWEYGQKTAPEPGRLDYVLVLNSTTFGSVRGIYWFME